MIYVSLAVYCIGVAVGIVNGIPLGALIQRRQDARRQTRGR